MASRAASSISRLGWEVPITSHRYLHTTSHIHLVLECMSKNLEDLSCNSDNIFEYFPLPPTNNPNIISWWSCPSPDIHPRQMLVRLYQDWVYKTCNLVHNYWLNIMCFGGVKMNLNPLFTCHMSFVYMCEGGKFNISESYRCKGTNVQRYKGLIVASAPNQGCLFLLRKSYLILSKWYK